MQASLRSSTRYRTVLATVSALAILSLPSVEAITQTWDGDTSTAINAAGNWVSGTAPVLNSTADVAAFNLGTAPTNQPIWTLGATNAIGGLIGGDSYEVSMILNAGNLSRVIDFGSTGIDTGSSAFAITGTTTLGSAGFRNIDIQVNTNQTWDVGSAGMTVAGSVNASSGTATVRLIGSGTLTKSGAGDVVWNGSVANSVAALTITSGGMIQGLANGQWVASTGTITLNGSTALIRQNAALGSRTILVDAGGGTFQATNGNQSWNLANQFGGTGDFTIDTTLLGGGAGGLTISENNTAYAGHLTLKTGGGTGFNRVTVTGTSNPNAVGDGSNSNHRLTINATDSSPSLFIGAVANNTTATSLTVGALSGNANAQIVASATNSSAVSTFTVNQYVTGTYAGTFANSGSGAFNLVKGQSGTLALAGNSSSWNKGSATINAGTMLIASSGALGTSAVDVALDTATLASSTTGLAIGNTVTTSGTGSNISPTGDFTLGALNAASGAMLSLDSSEEITLTGALTGATTAGSFVLDLSSGFTTGSSITIINFGSQSGVNVTDFVLSAAASSLYTLDAVNIDLDSVDITLGVIPEPATFGLLMGSIGVVLLLKRRRP